MNREWSPEIEADRLFRGYCNNAEEKRQYLKQGISAERPKWIVVYRLFMYKGYLSSWDCIEGCSIQSLYSIIMK